MGILFDYRASEHRSADTLLANHLRAVNPAPAKIPRARAGKAFLLTSLLLVALVLAVFLPTLRNGFVNYDDPDYVTSNPRVQQGLTLANASWAFRTDHAANWHPVTWLSHMLDSTLFGQNPAGHHFTSVLLHALTSALLFLLFSKMTGAPLRSFILAALFGLHPLRVESVAWVCERKDVLAGFFGVLTLWFYALWVARFRAFYYVTALVCFALGLMSKSMLVTLPFVMLLLDYWPLRRLRPDSAISLSTTLYEKLPFFALSAAASAMTLIVQAQAGAVKAVISYPIGARVGNSLVSYCRYLGKLFFPVNLAAFYPHPVYWPVLAIVGASVALLAISITALRLGRTHPWFLVGWLWFLGTAVPVIGLVQVGAQSMADRYTYIPSIGVILVLVWGLFSVANKWRWQRPLLLSISIFALGACAVCTARQIGFWHDSETLFRHAIAVTGKNPVAHMNLGVALMDENRSTEGLSELRKAVELAPDYSDAHLTLGTALEKTGDYDGAIDELDKAIHLDPNSSKAYLEAGVVFEKISRPQQAIPLFRQALGHNPKFVEAHGNLGVALEQTGLLKSALAEFLEAIRLDPNYFDAHQNLGSVYFKLSRIEEARVEFERGVKLKPGAAVAHNNLAGALFLLGRVDQAIAEYRKALKLDPNYSEAQDNLSGALRSKQP